MSDYFSSLLDNFKTRVTNPFLGTLAGVWIIRNWEIIYALFNFDDDCLMNEKILFIKSYFSKLNFYSELVKNLWISMGILLLTYCLLGISKSIVEFYYKILEKKIIVWIDKNAILTKEEANDFQNKIDNLYLAIEKAKKSEGMYEVDNQRLELDAKNVREILVKKEKEQQEQLEEYAKLESIYKTAKNVRSYKITDQSNKFYANFENIDQLFQTLVEEIDNRELAKLALINNPEIKAIGPNDINLATTVYLKDYKMIEEIEESTGVYDFTVLGYYFIRHLQGGIKKASVTRL